MENIYISDKDINRYLSACFFAFGKGESEIKLIGRGGNIKKTIDVAAILLRKYFGIENQNTDIYDIKIGSEKFNDKYISTIEILIRNKI